VKVEEVQLNEWSFSLSFLQVCNSTTDRNHADLALEKYVTESVMSIVKGFFGSQFSVNNSNLQVPQREPMKYIHTKIHFTQGPCPHSFGVASELDTVAP